MNIVPQKLFLVKKKKVGEGILDAILDAEKRIHRPTDLRVTRERYQNFSD